MPNFKGNTATSALSTAYEIPAMIKQYRLVNKTGGAITVNASILFGSTNISITPYNKSLGSGEVYIVEDANIMLAAGEQIYVLTTGSLDYHFTII